MYTNQDLEDAIQQGIFDSAAVMQFRDFVAKQRNTRGVDEESFRLVTSFNDIFVVIAIALLLISTSALTDVYGEAIAAFSVSVMSWGLSEFFVLKRRMALPAIVLLVTYTGSLFIGIPFFFDAFGMAYEWRFLFAALITAFGAWLHWKRFQVPITVAAGALAIVAAVIALVMAIFPKMAEFVSIITFLGGVGIFMVAMYWDTSDPQRKTLRSDVAFWLHLSASPLIVHTVFSWLDVFRVEQSVSSLVGIIALYFVLSVISLAVDRRAFMVSSLVYVLYALAQLLDNYGLAGNSFAYVGAVIGLSLLLLSAFWHAAREAIVSCFPAALRAVLPATR
uniref:hypothetical protein n=1 Tax=Thaumasiovibrio occultus TaxID=1891184 RepID=UPI000B34FDC0|nr:hypothetical protein [Thaumasiovibrio occultus]